MTGFDIGCIELTDQLRGTESFLGN